jgi:hypothetical protein
MAVSGHGDHQLKRIVLPSGKTIEVVYFGHEDAPPALPAGELRDDDYATAVDAATPAVRDDLHLCLECDSDLVYPVHWEEADEEHWHIVLRCPNCEWSETGVFEQSACDRFDEELERGTDALARDYKRLVTANLAEEIDRFVHALDVGGILPMDF